MVSKLDADVLGKWLGSHELWRMEGDALHCEVKFKNFVEAFGFLSRLAIVMEKQNHHAEIFNVYSSVKLSLCTHDAGNVVTEKDLKLAEAVDKLL